MQFRFQKIKNKICYITLRMLMKVKKKNTCLYIIILPKVVFPLFKMENVNYRM